jgi:hypothetical protein
MIALAVGEAPEASCTSYPAHPAAIELRALLQALAGQMPGIALDALAWVRRRSAIRAASN